MRVAPGHPNLVWRATMDGRYEVQVMREIDEPYKGRLYLYDGKETEPFVSFATSISYGAVFGPDVADVEEWCRIAAGYIDTLVSKKFD